MKTKVLWLIAAAFMSWGMFSCQETTSTIEPNQLDTDEMVPFSFTVGIPEEYATTRAGEVITKSHLSGLANLSGSSGYKLRFIMEVYEEKQGGGYDFILRKVQAKDLNQKSAYFTGNLISKPYRFVFWADITKESDPEKDLNYDTTTYGLDEIEDNRPDSIDADTPYAIDTRDAYAKYKDIDLSQTPIVSDITLTRPLGKYRIISAYAPAGQTPKTAEIRVGPPVITPDLFPSKYNALEDIVFGTDTDKAKRKLTLTIDYGTPKNLNGDDVDDRKGWLLGMDYFFASNAETKMDFEIFTTFDPSDEVNSKTINGIPMKANRLTTIYGNLAATSYEFTVTVSDDFDDEVVKP